MGFFVPGYEGVGAVRATFESALTRGTDEGKPVKVSANKTIVLAAATDQFVGFVDVIDQDEAVATVVVAGFITAPYTGTAPAVGPTTLEADGAGGVIEVTAAVGKKLFHVVNVDTANTELTFLL